MACRRGFDRIFKRWLQPDKKPFTSNYKSMMMCCQDLIAHGGMPFHMLSDITPAYSHTLPMNP